MMVLLTPTTRSMMVYGVLGTKSKWTGSGDTRGKLASGDVNYDGPTSEAVTTSGVVSTEPLARWKEAHCSLSGQIA
jgi:hypothetical protein